MQTESCLGKWFRSPEKKKAIKALRAEIRNSPFKYYIYAHYMDGKVAYIGKGTAGRAFYSANRSDKWYESLRNCDAFLPVILTWHMTKVAAIYYENYFILMLKPPCNKAVPSKELVAADERYMRSYTRRD